jgi:protease-4
MASRRTGLWLLTTLLLFFLVFTLFVWGVNRMLVGAPPSLGSGTVLNIRLQGAIGEIAQQGPFLGPLTVREIDEALRRAADDERVAAAFLDIGPLAGGYGKAQEVRAALQRFRSSGKPVIALLEVGSNLDLYVATAADTVYQVPSGQLILGMLMQQPYYRELFDSIGVEFRAFTSGPYKAAFSSFTERDISDAERQMSESLVESLYRQWIDDVAADRDLAVNRVEDAFDLGLLNAAQARDFGLVDRLGYRDQVDDELRDLAGRSPRRMSVRDYLRATRPAGLESVFSQGNVIALIHVNGLMVPGEFPESFLGSSVAAGSTIAGYVREAREDAAVRAIVLRVDSGGGAVSAADVMGREIELAAQRKPVVVSMSDVAASGGYWIASKATRVFANRATYTGSIGVVSGRLSLRGTYDLLGVNHAMIKRGENADLLADASRLRPEQEEILQRSVDATYRDFIDVVARGRGMEPDAVDAVAQGRVWTGLQALDNGLVDDIGGLRDALVAARAEAGIGAESSVAIRIYPPRRSFFEELSRLFTTVAMVRAVAPGPAAWLPPTAAETWHRMQTLLASGPVWALMDAALPSASR